MKTTKRLTIAMAVYWMLGFASTHASPAQGSFHNPSRPETFQPENQASQELGEIANISTNAFGLLQEIQAIQKLGEFMQMVVDLQAQGFMDGLTANSLSASGWSMIGKIARLSGVAADCRSIADLTSEVNATGLKQKEKGRLIRLLHEAQGYLDQAQADLKAGNSKQALWAQLAAIQKLEGFIKLADEFQRARLIDQSTAEALETCAMNLVGTVNVSLSTGLVAYYPFSGDANDASGSGNNGRVVGATFQTYAPPMRWLCTLMETFPHMSSFRAHLLWSRRTRSRSRCGSKVCPGNLVGTAGAQSSAKQTIVSRATSFAAATAAPVLSWMAQTLAGRRRTGATLAFPRSQGQIGSISSRPIRALMG